MCFCDVSKIVVNSKILIISGMPTRVIFQNLVTLEYGAVLFKGAVQLTLYPETWINPSSSTTVWHNSRMRHKSSKYGNPMSNWGHDQFSIRRNGFFSLNLKYLFITGFTVYQH